MTVRVRIESMHPEDHAIFTNVELLEGRVEPDKIFQSANSRVRLTPVLAFVSPAAAGIALLNSGGRKSWMKLLSGATPSIGDILESDETLFLTDAQRDELLSRLRAVGWHAGSVSSPVIHMSIQAGMLYSPTQVLSLSVTRPWPNDLADMRDYWIVAAKARRQWHTDYPNAVKHERWRLMLEDFERFAEILTEMMPPKV